jgi:uncharacterized protein involved in exopolysaccharide biosynthesis
MAENSNLNITASQIVGSSLLDFLFILAKRRKYLSGFILFFVLGSLILALLTPKEYRASTSVLPADKSDLLSSLSGLSSLAKSFSPLKGLGGLSGNDELDRYIAILKSQTVQTNVIEKFNLKKVYNLEDQPQWKVVKKLNENLEINIEDEGNLVVSILDENPKLAANIANYFVELLNDVNSNLHVRNATATREFIEKRYLQNLEDITKYEIEMRNFQEKYGVIAVPEQVEATIKSVSQLYVDLAREEVELNVLKKTIAAENPLLRSKEIQVNEIRSSLDKITNQKIGSINIPRVFVPLKSAPELIGKYLNIYKNIEIQYKIAEFITPVYEQAKIEEARNTPSVLILDKASPPDRKAKPKISLYLIIGFVVSLIFGLFTVFTYELFIKLKYVDTEKYLFIKKIVHPYRFFSKNS